MSLPKGHTECYFSEVNRLVTKDIEIVKQVLISQAAGGWKVAYEQTNLVGKPLEYTIYWGA